MMTNKKFLYALAAAAVALPAFSRPASPELKRHVNPDGTVVEYYINGDENFHYLSDASRTTILERKGDMVSPLVRNGQQLQLNEANLNKLRAEFPNTDKIISPSAGNVSRMASLDGTGRTTYPTLGEVRGCVILLEFPDTPFISEDPKDQFYRLCNEKGYSDYGSQGSAKDYFEACSNGKFTPTFDVYGPVRLKHEAKWYVGDDDPSLPGYHHHARIGYAIQEALQELDPTVDFSIYDYDDNGEIDNIFFFYSGYGQADTGDVLTIWPHQSSYQNYTNMYTGTLGLDRLYVDGKEMVTYACSCELNGSEKVPVAMRPCIDGIGAFCHEFGHVLGLPDLYDVLNTHTSTPGTYTVMDNGSYNHLSTCPPLFSAYERWLCRWIEFTDSPDLENGQDVTLIAQSSPDANAVRVRIPRPGTNRYYDEYYVLECRNEQGWDKSLDQHGMLIWHINYNKNSWWSNRVNVNGTSLVSLVSPNKKSEIKAWPGEDNQATFLYPGSAEFTTVSTKKVLNTTLTNITYDYDNPEADKVTFEYNKYEENALTTDIHAYASEENPNAFILTWTPVADATDYQLTLTRRTSTAQYTVGGLNGTSVGNVNSYLIENLTPTQMKQNFTATIKVISGLPSSKTTTVTFVPADLEVSGVDGIDADSLMIFGGKGEITAPEGARAFNLSGVETGLTNLAPGVYIVVTPKATAKVIVR